MDHLSQSYRNHFLYITMYVIHNDIYVLAQKSLVIHLCSLAPQISFPASGRIVRRTEYCCWYMIDIPAEKMHLCRLFICILYGAGLRIAILNKNEPDSNQIYSTHMNKINLAMCNDIMQCGISYATSLLKIVRGHVGFQSCVCLNSFFIHNLCAS